MMARRRIRIAACLAIALAGVGAGPGCSHGEKIVHGELDRARIFPYGTYQHDVSLRMGERKMSFQGVAKLSEDWVRIAVLTAFGTTAFKINEDRRTGKVETQVFIDALKPHEDRLRDYYATLRRLLLARQGSPVAPAPGVENLKSSPGDELSDRHYDAQSRLIDAKVEEGGATARIEFGDYDGHGIPSRIAIHHPRYDVEIRVAGYAL